MRDTIGVHGVSGEGDVERLLRANGARSARAARKALVVVLSVLLVATMNPLFSEPQALAYAVEAAQSALAAPVRDDDQLAGQLSSDENGGGGGLQ